MQEAGILRKLCKDGIFLAVVVAGAVVLAFSNTVMLPAYLLAIAPEIYYTLEGSFREM